MGAAKDIKIVDILARYSPAFADTWADAFATLNDSPSDREVIDALLKALKSHGGFREPIVLDNDEMSICNGMHRIAASVEAGMETIATVDEYPPPVYDGQVLDLTFKITHGNATDPQRSTTDRQAADEAADWAHAWLSSMRLDENTWANCDGLGGTTSPGPGATVSGTWYVEHARANDLVAMVRARATAAGWAVSDLKVAPHVDLAEDYFDLLD